MNRRKLWPALAGLVTLVTMLLASGMAFAQDGEADGDVNLVTRLADLAFDILTPVLIILAGWLAHRLVGIIEKKFSVDVPERQEALLDTWIEQGIHLAEEWSRNKVKHEAKKATGPEKLEVAAGFVLDLVESRGWIDWGKERLLAKIEAKLGHQRVTSEKPALDGITDDDLPAQ